MSQAGWPIEKAGSTEATLLSPQQLIRSVSVLLHASQERAKKFVTGTIKAGNPMLVNTRGTEDFDKLKGNKDFKPLHKLLLHRHFILDALADMPERRAEWELAGQTLESFIDIVWIRGYSSDDDRWEGTMLAREFVWRFSKLAPPER